MFQGAERLPNAVADSGTRESAPPQGMRSIWLIGETGFEGLHGQIDRNLTVAAARGDLHAMLRQRHR